MSIMESSTETPPPSRRRPIAKRLLRILGYIIIITVLLIGAWLLWRAKSTDKRSPITKAEDMTVHDTPRSQSTPQITANVVADKRHFVWDMAFLPDGDMLFTERMGTLNRLQGASVSEVTQITDVYAEGEGGLMGLTIDPAFKTNRTVYTCYNSTAADIRVVRWQLSGDKKSLKNRRDIITGIPANTTTYPGRHSGCRLGFGPDGYLWVGTGDTAQGDVAIQPKSLGGKVLRVDRNGKAAPGNVGGNFDARIFSYGHRNIQGLAFFNAPKHDNVPGLSVEHGSSIDDEVNELHKGNFGWAPPAGSYNESGVPMTDSNRFPDAIQAIWSSGNVTQATCGATIVYGAQWKGWDSALAVVALKDKHLKVLRLDDKNRVTKEERALSGTFGRLRSIVQGPDGDLYIATSNGDDKIIRVSPQ